MAPLLATILVTCCAHADDMSLDGSLRSKLIPAMNEKRQATHSAFRVNFKSLTPLMTPCGASIALKCSKQNKHSSRCSLKAYTSGRMCHSVLSYRRNWPSPCGLYATERHMENLSGGNLNEEKQSNKMTSVHKVPFLTLCYQTQPTGSTK